MQKKTVKGNTENLNMLNEKVNYIGFELGEVPAFLKKFEPLNYRVPKVYDETTYKLYKYISIDDIEILITPTNRLDDLEEKYKYASPIFTYMQAKNSDEIEKYAQFLKMINQTKIEDIKAIEVEQTNMEKNPPFEVKFPSNFKWQIYYSDYADKYFMLASTDESDNSELFYLLKKKIEINKDKRRKKGKIFVPICNEEYSEKILKKSEISDLENYLWFFTKNWPSIYEVTDMDDNLSLQIVGETLIYDKMTSKYNIKIIDKKEAAKEYKLIKALFILAYDIPNEYQFETKIDENGKLIFCYNGEEITYGTLSDFMKKEAKSKIQENVKIKLETNDLKADIKDLQKHSEEQNEEYMKKERQIYMFLECRKTFFGKVKYFFKGKKKQEDEEEIIQPNLNKKRLKEILDKDKDKEKLYQNDEEDDISKLYTVEDIIKICKELNENIKENKNIKLDIQALNNKVANLDRKIKNATQYIEEIEKHKKSIFEFWKFANKDEDKALEEGETEEEKAKENLKRTFNYEDDIDTLANEVDKKQRELLTHNEMDAIFAGNFVIDGVNLISKKKPTKADESKIKKMLMDLQNEYKNNIEKIEKKDFDIFGNVSEDKSKVKVLNNNMHRETEKDKFKILNVNMNTELLEFTEKLQEIKSIIENSNKVETPYNLSIYKASTEKLDTENIEKFDLNPQETLEKIEENSENKDIYLYKINIPEKTKLVFYSNIIFYENNNNTLPLGMDVSQEVLIDMNLYNLDLKSKDEFDINICKDEFTHFIRKVKVYEYDINAKLKNREGKNENK